MTRTLTGLFAAAFLAAFSLTADADYYTPGAMVAGKLLCRDKQAILHIANEDTKNLDAVRFALDFERRRGKCAVMARRVPVVLKERIHEYQDFSGATTEVWSVVSDQEIYILLVVPGPKKSNA